MIMMGSNEIVDFFGVLKNANWNEKEKSMNDFRGEFEERLNLLNDSILHGHGIRT